MIITRSEVKDKAKCEALVEMRLDDIGFDEREHGPELRATAKQYYLSLIEEDLANSEGVFFDKCFDSAEGLTLGFIAGYQACLKSHC